MTARSLLVVDDDARLRERLVAAFVERGYRALGAGDHTEAIAIARAQPAREPIARAVVDLRMPGAHGLVVVRDLIELAPAIEIVVLTGYGSIATAVEAIKLGACNYLQKPANADQIHAAFEPMADADADTELAFEVPTIAKLEREHIERVLAECGGNKSRAARALGLHRRTLQYKLAKFPVKR